MPNVLKYALSIDPLANNAPLGLPRIFSQAGAKVFRHIKPSWATDLTYRYEISRTLGSWSPAILNVDYTQTNTPLANGIIQSDLTILGPWTKSFMRAAVDLAP